MNQNGRGVASVKIETIGISGTSGCGIEIVIHILFGCRFGVTAFIRAQKSRASFERLLV